MALSELTRPGTSLRDKLVGVGAVVVGQVISGLYKTLDKMGFVSGQEFLVAMEEAKAVGANILLGDRNVQVTLRRLSEALSQSDLVKIREMESPTRSPAAKELAARGLDVGVGADAKDIAVAVEALKDRASVRKLMGALKQELPAVYQAMIAERCVTACFYYMFVCWRVFVGWWVGRFGRVFVFICRRSGGADLDVI